jgi:uncharacterized protein (TIGR00304 family)
MSGSMRHVRLLGLALLIAGVALIAASVATGQGQVYLLLFIPVYVGTGALGMLGILVLFSGFFLATLGSAWRGVPVPAAPAPDSASSPESIAPPSPAGPPARYGGVIMLGPIPIVFGSDARIAKWMMILGLILAGFVIASFLILSLGAVP